MENLSLFHSELLAFMQTKVKSLADVDDLDSLRESEEFSRLALSPMMSLESIFESYKHIFDDQKSIQVERLWMDSLSESEFVGLGLGKYFPKIYRGLPRVYLKENPSESQIKPDFTSLASLKWLSVDRAIFSLYEGKASKKLRKVGIFTWVRPDGLGDWVAAQEAALILQGKMPWLQIELFPISKRKLEKSLNFPTHLTVYEGEETVDCLPLKELKEMDFVLQMPTFFPNSSFESIGEYGFLESSWFHPKSNCRSMGLHALEKGIFIRKHHQTTFAEIEQKKLLLLLFGTEMPGPVEIDSYEQSVRFHVGYLSTGIGGAIYLHSLLNMWKRDEKNIDICSPDPNWFIEWYDKRESEGLPLLQGDYGVREILVLWDGQSRSFPLSDKGKQVRILCPGTLSHTDMQKLISLSGEWVGVRGNQSLTEAISAGKAFFYDGREHARYFIKDLLAMAENRISGHRSTLHAFRMMGQAFLWNLDEETGPWVEETHFQREDKMNWFDIATELGLSLQDSDCIAGFKKYCRICAEERSFNPFLCHFVERALFHLERPDVQAKEAELVSQYVTGKISLSSFVKNLRGSILSI